MNNVTYYAGKSLKQTLEMYPGNQYSAAHFAVAFVLKAKEEGMNLDQMVSLVNEAEAHDPVAHQNQLLKELGF